MQNPNSSESLVSLIRRAEKRVGRPFLGMTKDSIDTRTLLDAGMRVQRDELGSEVDVWVLSFGYRIEEPTYVYGRTIPHAFQRAVYPEGRKPRRNTGRSI